MPLAAVAAAVVTAALAAALVATVAALVAAVVVVVVVVLALAAVVEVARPAHQSRGGDGEVVWRLPPLRRDPVLGSRIEAGASSSSSSVAFGSPSLPLALALALRLRRRGVAVPSADVAAAEVSIGGTFVGSPLPAAAAGAPATPAARRGFFAELRVATMLAGRWVAHAPRRW